MSSGWGLNLAFPGYFGLNIGGEVDEGEAFPDVVNGGEEILGGEVEMGDAAIVGHGSGGLNHGVSPAVEDLELVGLSHLEELFAGEVRFLGQLIEGETDLIPAFIRFGLVEGFLAGLVFADQLVEDPVFPQIGFTFPEGGIHLLADGFLVEVALDDIIRTEDGNPDGGSGRFRITGVEGRVQDP